MSSSPNQDQLAQQEQTEQNRKCKAQTMHGTCRLLLWPYLYVVVLDCQG